MRGKTEEINHKTLVLNYLKRRGLRREEKKEEKRKAKLFGQNSAPIVD